jgi:cell division protein FtsN
MARDYKHRRKPAKKGKGGGSFATGLTLGLTVAVLVHLYHQGRTPDRALEDSSLATRPAAQEPEPIDDSELEFDFYTILTAKEELVPEKKEVSGGQKAETSVGNSSGNYYLQAGSFQNHTDADRRKATLALLGVAASIQRVTIKENQTWYRVRVGPIDDINEVNRLRSKLEVEKIQTMLARAKESQ